MPILYQRTWNGVDLMQIAADPARLDRGIPNATFYAEYYRQLRQRGNNLPSEWLEAKSKNSKLLARWIDEAAAHQRVDPLELSVLSIGAGLGFVELPLAKSGYRVTLHDVQTESLHYVSEQAQQGQYEVDVVSGALTSIGRTFDLVYLGLCEYCIAEKRDYLTFLQEVRSLVSDRGRLIAADLAPTLRTYVAAATAPYRPQPGVRWGRLRSAAARCRALRQSGFTVIAHESYDSAFQLRASGRGQAGPGLPPRHSDFVALVAVPIPSSATVPA